MRALRPLLFVLLLSACTTTTGSKPREISSSPLAGTAAVPPVAEKPEIDPTPLVRRAPKYPIQLVETGIGGHVIVEYSIAPDGHVQSASVVESVPSGAFDFAALEAVRSWKFAPLDQEVTGAKRERVKVRLTFEASEAMPFDARPDVNCRRAPIIIERFEGLCLASGTTIDIGGQVGSLEVQLRAHIGETLDLNGLRSIAEFYASEVNLQLLKGPVVLTDAVIYQLSGHLSSRCVWASARHGSGTGAERAVTVGLVCGAELVPPIESVRKLFEGTRLRG